MEGTKMQNRVIVLAATVIGIAGIQQFASAAAATIYSLGTSDGFNSSRAYSVNATGQAAVTSVELFGAGTAYRYDNGALHNLGSLSGYLHAFSNAINSSGQVVGYAQINSFSTATRAFRYEGTPGAGGVMRDL